MDSSTFQAFSPHTNIWEKMNILSLDRPNLAGEIIIQFRSQGDNNTQGISLEGNFRVRSLGDGSNADAFCKTIQYLFEWTDKWVKEVDLKNQYGYPFVLPRFLYSKAQFENSFLDKR
jgi:hypothetical protein